jgi:hypothetical protein
MRILTGLLWTLIACPLIGWFSWISLNSAMHGFLGGTAVSGIVVATALAALFPALAGRWGVAFLAALVSLGGTLLVMGAFVVMAFPRS